MTEIRERLKRARAVNTKSGLAITSLVKDKVSNAKRDRRVIALELIQIMLVILVLLAALFFIFPQNPELTNFPKLFLPSSVSEKIPDDVDIIRSLLSVFYPQEDADQYISNLPQPPINYILFAIVVSAAIWLYRFTNWYRHEREQSKSLLTIELFLLFFIFMSIILYLDPKVNVFPEPFSYLIFSILLLALTASLTYLRFFRKR